MKTSIQENDLQGSGYQNFVVIVRTDPNAYHVSPISPFSANDTTDEILLEEIFEKYSGAWKKLAKM